MSHQIYPWKRTSLPITKRLVGRQSLN